jgi:hypothetical protein
MRNYRFMSKCIIALLSCIIGLSSCGNKNKIPTNEILYTTVDNGVLPIKDSYNFGKGRIVSNSYVPDKNICILKFDKDVTEIGKGTFLNCSSLTSISIPPSVTEIGDYAISLCSSLTSITIPESVTKIGDGAFSDCSSLTSISIPPSVRWIGESTFSNCSSLTSITVSKDNKVYDSREDCNAIIHTKSNTLIQGCEKTIIPPSVTKIWKYAFSDCSNLTSITIPESVTTIGDGAFKDCKNLTEVRIPKGCNVDEWAFKNCPKVRIIRC